MRRTGQHFVLSQTLVIHCLVAGSHRARVCCRVSALTASYGALVFGFLGVLLVGCGRLRKGPLLG